MGGDEQLLKWDPECTPPTADTETDCVCVLTKGSFVLSEIPSPKEVSFVGKTQSAFLLWEECTRCSVLCGARSVGKQAGQPGEINADSVLKRNTLLLQLLKEMQC